MPAMMNGEKENSHRIPRSEMLSRLEAAMPGILIGKPVMLAYLYGSTADGSRLPFSDVDIALVLAPDCPLSAYERMQLELDLAAEIERLCDIRETDVRSIDAAPLTVQGMVVSEGILLYSRDEEFRIQYEVHTRKLYFDFLPVMEMMRAAFFNHVQQEGLASGKAG
jgi:predicted nucleotidyltransferase